MGEVFIGVPERVWKDIRSSYAQSPLPELRQSLLELDLKNLSGVNLVIKNRLEVIFNFIDDIAQLDDVSKLKDRN